MDYKYLGKTGVKVSELCFGTMSFGGDADKEASLDMYRAVREAGINFFDCANVYQKGIAETFLGDFMGEERKKLIITSKAYFTIGEDVNDCGSSRKHLTDALDDSLRRLKTDYIDIYFLHRFDDNTPLEETLRVLDDLVKSGKILYIGVSNFAAWQVMKAQGTASVKGLNDIKCIQPMYSLVKRQAEVELLPMAQNENIAVTPYSPLGAGLLTGKYGTTAIPKTGRIVNNKMYNIRYENQRYLETADKFTGYAKERGLNPVSLAIKWVASHPAVTAPLIGARNVGQLKDSLNSIKIKMTDVMREEISLLGEVPPPATDRNEEASSFNYAAVLKK